MAEIKSFPNNQDEFIGAEEVMKWLHGRTSGVFGAAGCCATAPVLDKMAVTVSDGIGWLSNDDGDGIVWWVGNEKSSGAKLRLDLDMADAVLPRIDRVIVSWQTTNYVALPEVRILKGTPSSEPAAPALTNSSILRQISLAQIRIPAGTLAITSSMITDERLDKKVCGIVTESVEIDTSVLNDQAMELIESLRAHLQDVKDGSPFIMRKGDRMQGPLDMASQKITNLPAPTDDGDATNKKYVDGMLPKAGGTMTGSLHMNNKYITDLAYPGSPGDAANKKYVDDRTNDYVVAKGTFTNGGWRKWNSGVAEIWESKIIMYDETIGHLSNGDFLKVITFPFSFIDIYYAATFGAAGIAGGADGGNIACGENGEYSNRSRNSMKLIASSDGTTWQYPRMSYHVIGRWK